MAINYPLAFPSSPAPERARLSMRNVVASSTSPYSLESQSQRHQGQLWMVDLTMPPLQGEAELGEWAAFLTSLRGRWGSFIWAPPDRNRGSFASSENLLLWSEDFSNAAWEKSGVTVTANAATAPDGAATAEKIVGDNGQSFSYVIQNVSVADNTRLCGSVFAKAAEFDSATVRIRLKSDGTYKGVSFNLTSETFYGSDAEAVDYGYEPISDGWYRVWVTVDVGSGAFTSRFVVYPTTGTTSAGGPGDGTSGIYIWGAQLEEGTEPGIYLKTTSAETYAPRVDGASQTGESLATEGWTASALGLLKAGDLIQLGSGGSTRLYRVLTDVDSDADGKATIDIWPRLRSSPADGDAVVINNAAGLWRLSDNSASILLEPALIARVQFSIEEYI